MRLTNTGKVKGSAGGIARGITSRKEALDRYYSNPNKCLECNSIINVKEGHRVYEARIQKFCKRSCSASYNNRLREYPEKEIIEKEKYIKPISILDNTKGYYKENCSNWWSARVPIAKTARLVYNRSDKPKQCFICGYNKHYEVCHIKAVNEFEDNVLLRDINHIDNLVALCRNHHWELDNNLIEI